jgi:hypothetical protein
LNTATRRYLFDGNSSVRTLPNLNPSGLGNDITLNLVSRAQYQIDNGSWITAETYGTPTAKISLNIGSLPSGQHTLRIRTRDDDSGVISNVFQDTYFLPNRAPVLDNSSSPKLTAIAEDNRQSAGTLVSALTAGITDADAGALKGIAVTAASDFYGTWQFSLNGGASWQAMGAPTGSAARLLPADSSARIRFQPNLNFNGTVKLYYRAWDRTNGTAGGTLNTSGNTGGSKTLSTAAENASLVVKPVNDRPVLSLSGTISYKRNQPAVLVAPFASLSDVDSPNFGGGQLTVRISSGASSANRLEIAGQFTVSPSGAIKLGSAVIGTLHAGGGEGTTNLVVTFTTAATKIIVKDLVRAITFRTIAGALAGSRSVLFKVSDGDGGTSDEMLKTVKVL